MVSESSDEPSDTRASRRRASPRFDEFYGLYPKRANRKAAKTKWDTATRSGVPVDDILAGARRYAEHVRRERTEARYVKAPDVWLNKGCWDDEYDEPAVEGGAGWTLPDPPPGLEPGTPEWVQWATAERDAGVGRVS